MKIPLTQYEVAHVRKAIFAGLGMAGSAFGAALASGVPLQTVIAWPAVSGLIGAFIVGLFGTFKIPNKDFLLAQKVIEEINPALGEKVAVILDPVMAAREPTDKPAATQEGPVDLVSPPDPPATPIAPVAPAE